MGDFLVMLAAFTAGGSTIILVIAGAIKHLRAGAPSEALRGLRDEVEQLRGELDSLRNEIERSSRPAEIDDIQNRLDFAERMLAQVKARDALPPGPR